MPQYEYRCEACRRTVTLRLSITEHEKRRPSRHAFFLLFVRFLPMVAMAEVKGVMKGHGNVEGLQQTEG